MELRLVDRTLRREFAFPIPNDSQRIKGFGILGEDRRIVLTDGDGIQHITSRADEIMSIAKQGDGMCFLTVIDNTNRSLTRVWNEKEFMAFIVNDNGKTIDRISS